MKSIQGESILGAHDGTLTDAVFDAIADMQDATITRRLGRLLAERDALEAEKREMCLQYLATAGQAQEALEEAASWRMAAQEAELECKALRAKLSVLRAATEPDAILAAMDDVHDMDVSLNDYAAAVSRAIRAAIEETPT